MTNTKKKKISQAILILLTVSLIAMFSWIVSAASRTDKTTELLRLKATRYVEDKYGFKAELKDIDIEYDYRTEHDRDDPDSAVSAKLLMKHDGKKFNVYFNYRNGKGYDNYQFREIRSALEERLNSEIPGGIIYDFRIFSKDYDDKHEWGDNYGMLSKEAYYDGKDLSKVIENTVITMYAVYTDTKFHDCKFFDEIGSNSANSLFLCSFVSEAARYECYCLSEPDECDDFAPYISDRWEVTNSRSHSFQPYDIRDCGDFLVYGKNLKEDHEIEVIEIKDVESVVDELGDKISTDDEDYFYPLTKKYRFVIKNKTNGEIYKTDNYVYNELHVYYPVGGINIAEHHTIVSSVNGKRSYTMVCGDYISATLRSSNGFCFFEEKEPSYIICGGTV